MNIKECLNFEFTDRVDERRELKDFIKKPFQTSNILWLTGEKNVGKTRLLKEVIKSCNNDKDLLFVNVAFNDGNGGADALEAMLHELESQSGQPLSQFLSKALQESEVPDTPSQEPIIRLILNAVFSVAKVLITSDGKRTAPYIAIGDCIKRICEKKRVRIVLIFDDLDSANNAVFDTVHNLIASLLRDDQIRIIVTTSSNDTMTRAFDIEKMLLEVIEDNYFKLYPFGDVKYFRAILEKVFPNLRANDSCITEIFEKCNGNVGMLCGHLLDYLIHDYDIHPARDLKNFSRHIDQPKPDFITQWPMWEQSLIRTASSIKVSVPQTTLLDAVEFSLRNMVHMEEQGFAIAIYLKTACDNLLEAGVLHRNSHNTLELKLPQDRLSRLPCEEGLYRFFKEQNKSNWSKIMPHIDRLELLARLSRESGSVDALGINLDLVRDYLLRGLDFNACQVFRFLIESGDIAFVSDASLLLQMAEAFYCSGDYHDADRTLDSLNQLLDGMSGRSQYAAYLLKGKLNNLMGDLDAALTWLNKAESTAETPDEKLAVKSMEQLVFTEMPNKSPKAKAIMDSTIAHLLSKSDYSRTEYLAARTLVDFYPNSEHDEILDKALSSAIRHEDDLGIAFLETARGLQFLRKGDTNLARKSYLEACDRLKSVRPHEQSYLINNLGVCEMIEGSNFDDALDCFRHAQAWNVSPFMRIVLRSNNLICYGLLGREDEAFKLIEELQRVPFSSENPLIACRVSMAICFTLLLFDGIYRTPNPYRNLFDDCMTTARKMIATPRQSERLTLYDRIVEFPSLRGELLNGKPSYHGVLFQPWVTTLHHD